MAPEANVKRYPISERGCWWLKWPKPSPTPFSCHQYFSSPTSVTKIDNVLLIFREFLFLFSKNWPDGFNKCYGRKSQVHFLLVPSFKEIVFDILTYHYPKSLLQYKIFVSLLLCVIWLKHRVQHNICCICYGAYVMLRNSFVVKFRTDQFKQSLVY